MIRLEDYGHNLGSRVLWLAARYRVDAIHPALSIEVSSLGGEWWDNNDGGNYRVAFRAAPLLPSPSSSNRLRRETAPGEYHYFWCFSDGQLTAKIPRANLTLDGGTSPAHVS